MIMTILNFINSLFTTLFGWFFIPFEQIHPAWGMLIVSLVMSILMLVIFKRTSDQKGVRVAKNHVKAHFLAIRLYRDDISLMFNTMKNILVSNGRYIKKSFRPMLFMIVPVSIILIQIGSRYEYRPLKVGESTLVTVHLGQNIPEDQINTVELQLPDGLVVDAPPVRIYSMREINWRIVAKSEGDFDVVFKVGDTSVSKKILVKNGLTALSKQIAKSQLSVTLMNPTEASLPGTSKISSILVQYPTREFEFLGFTFHWLIAFFVFSILFAFSLKGVMGVEV